MAGNVSVATLLMTAVVLEVISTRAIKPRTPVEEPAGGRRTYAELSLAEMEASEPKTRTKIRGGLAGHASIAGRNAGARGKD